MNDCEEASAAGGTGGPSNKRKESNHSQPTTAAEIYINLISDSDDDGHEEVGQESGVMVCMHTDDE
jgi:hypothetical protein